MKTTLLFETMGAAVFLSGVSAANVGALAESQPDQQQTSSEYSWPIDRWNTLVGQTFIAGASGQLARVSIHAGCCQNSDQALAPGLPPGDLVVKIHAVDPTTGDPTDVVLGYGREPASSFPTDGSLAWVDVALSPAPGVEAGNEDASPVERNLTVDTTPPTVASVGSANGARGVPRNTDVEVTFSEAIDPCSVQESTFKLARWNKQKRRWQWVTAGVSTQPPEVGCFANPSPPETASLDPYPSDPPRLLAKDAKYMSVITSEVMDPTGNFLAEDHVWYFGAKGG